MEHRFVGIPLFDSGCGMLALMMSERLQVAAALALAIENQQVNVCRLLVSFDRAAATQVRIRDFVP